MDKTNLMVNIMKMELKKFYEIKDSFIKKFSKKDFEDLDEVLIQYFKDYFVI